MIHGEKNRVSTISGHKNTLLPMTLSRRLGWIKTFGAVIQNNTKQYVKLLSNDVFELQHHLFGKKYVKGLDFSGVSEN